MRRHTAVDDLRQLGQHDHVAWWGDGPEDLDRIAVDAFADGAARHERMMFVAVEPDPSRLAALPGLDALIASGDLEFAALADVYEDVESFEPGAQLTVFEQAVDDALSRGYSGIRVVADNTPFLRGSDGAFASWLEWEYLADHLQATRPVAGVCFFDVRDVCRDRLADLAAAHPMLPADSAEPPFRLFCDNDVVRVVGSLEALFAQQMQRAISRLPAGRPMTIDLSSTEFVDHRALLVLSEAASPERQIVVRGARAGVRRLWDLLDVPESDLVFEHERAGARR